jgi:hypothetical protein
MVGLRAADDSRLWRWGSSVQRVVRVSSAGRITGSGADSVDAVEAVGSALIFCQALSIAKLWKKWIVATESALGSSLKICRNNRRLV